MENKRVDLFVPGRLCLMGEHSDWAGKYRNVNSSIEKGYALVTGIEEGIYATVCSSNDFIVEFLNDENKKFSCQMSCEKLKEIARQGSFWSYVAGVSSCIMERYNVGGVKIVITKETIPIKKGLSSSAAICVLVARAFNQIYNLHLDTLEEMNLAYLGEITTSSRCGQLDQICAFGKVPILMTFDGNTYKTENIKVAKDLYFAFADLNSKKDTIKILDDLNRSFPFAKSKLDEDVQLGLGKLNKETVLASLECIEKGDVKGLGILMQKAQEIFDKYVAPACPQELTAPILHKTLNDEYLKSLSYGRKGVGSQGDGTIQFLAKDKETQEKIKEYLDNELRMKAYTLTINKTNPVKKAIIPVAGNGTRMFPITKAFRKAFLPIIDSDGILKPAIMCLLEELDEAGIEKICLIIDESDQKDYDKFFKGHLSEEHLAKLSKDMLDYERKIQKIGKKLTYIYQKEKLGLGHAVSLCEKFANNEPVLLVLGDQLYKTTNNFSCTTQVLESFSKTNKLTVSVSEVALEDVSKYGILCGTVKDEKDFYDVDKMYEKPNQIYAKENLYTSIGTIKKYYAVFGEYILTPSVFEVLKENIKNNNKENGEFQITSVLDKVREKEGMIAYIVDGEMLDIGNVEAYKNTLLNKLK